MESWVTEKAKLILIRPQLLSAQGKHSGGMVCCMSYKTCRLAIREERIMWSEREKANKNLAFELTKHMAVPAAFISQCACF